MKDLFILFIVSVIMQVIDDTWLDMSNNIVTRYFIKLPLDKPLFKDKKLNKKKKVRFKDNVKSVDWWIDTIFNAILDAIT